jgi:hypothetical protein
MLIRYKNPCTYISIIFRYNRKKPMFNTLDSLVKGDLSESQGPQCHLCRDELVEGQALIDFGKCSHRFHLSCVKSKRFNPFQCINCEPLPLSSLYPSKSSSPLPIRERKVQQKRGPKRTREPKRYTHKLGYGISKPSECKEWKDREEKEQVEMRDSIDSNPSILGRMVKRISYALQSSRRASIFNMMEEKMPPSEMYNEGVLLGDILEQKVTIGDLSDLNYTALEFKDAYGPEFGACTLVEMGMELGDLLHEDSPCFMSKRFSSEFQILYTTPVQLLIPDVNQIARTVSMRPKNLFKKLDHLGIDAEYMINKGGLSAENIQSIDVNYDIWKKNFGLTHDHIVALEIHPQTMLDMGWPRKVIEAHYPDFDQDDYTLQEGDPETFFEPIQQEKHRTRRKPITRPRRKRRTRVVVQSVIV